MASVAQLEAKVKALTTTVDALKADVAKLKAAPPPPPPPPEPTIPPVSVGTTRVYIPAGDSIQDAIDRANHGTMFTLGRGVHRLTTALDGSPHRALWFEGEGGIGYNEGGLDGTVLRGETPGMVIYRDMGHDAAGLVKHSGPGFERVNFHAAAPDITPLFTRMVNHVTLKNLAIQGTMARALDIDVPIAVHDKGDNAYTDIDRVNIVNTQADALGIHMGDGFLWARALNIDMAGQKPCAIRNLRGVVNLMQSKFNHSGTHVYSSGSSGTIIGNDFEQFPYTGVYCLIFERGSNELPGAGCYHKVIGNNFTPHTDSGIPGSNLGKAKTIYLGEGTFGNHVKGNRYLYLGPESVVNLGNNPVIVD